MAPVVIDEIRLIGSRCGPFEPALEMLTDGRVRVDAMISAEYPLEKAVEAFEHAERPDTLNGVVDVQR
jgi:threonine dehydrogenase-like Zn-dependent dehydrogenase